jgi:superfamily I DNA/RNA helicase
MKALADREFLSGLSAKTRGYVEQFTGLLDRYETRMHEPLAVLRPIAEKLLEETGYLEDLRRTCKSPEESLMREGAIRELLADLERSQDKRNDGLRGFLDDVTLDRDRETEDDLEKKQGVTLITLHAAKGLEFPHVYLVGLEEGILPHDRSKLEGSLDEERRLLYVGITRAMKTLHITWCGTRIRYGSPSPCHPSSFLTEMDDRFVERLHHAQIRNTPMSEESVKTGFAALRAALSGL